MLNIEEARLRASLSRNENGDYPSSACINNDISSFNQSFTEFSFYSSEKKNDSPRNSLPDNSKVNWKSWMRYARQFMYRRLNEWILLPVALTLQVTQNRRRLYIFILALLAALLLFNAFAPSRKTAVNLSTSAPISVSTTTSQRVFVSESCAPSWSENAVQLMTQNTPVLPNAEHGVSVVAACRNRLDNLPKLVRNWKLVPQVKEIVLVDWSSTSSMSDSLLKSGLLIDDGDGGGMESHDQANHGESSACVRVIRVEGETSWILSRAYNLGMRLARYNSILRLDCDHAVSAKVVDVHPLSKDLFYSGDYNIARNPNEVHLNGAMFIRRADFWKVSGYDERIQTYGWDDEDLYLRLSSHARLQRKPLNYSLIAHIPHTDEARAQKGVRFVQVQVDFNRLLLEKLPLWGSTSTQASAYNFEIGPGTAIARAQFAPSALSDIVGAQVRSDAWNLAIGRRLHDEYQVPWDMFSNMETPMKELLLDQLDRLDEHHHNTQESSHRPPRVLIAHVQHGLGNRLRALGSALAFANSTRRALLVVWEPDRHCGARFDELFELSYFAVSSKFVPVWPFAGASGWDKAWDNIDFYNYMEMEGHNAQKGQVIRDVPGKHLYFKSAYVLEVADKQLTFWEKDSAMLQTLVPIPMVREQLKLAMDQGLGSMVGVHIRSRSLQEDIKSVQDFSKEYGAEGAKTMDYWRKMSSPNTFIHRMQQLEKQSSDVKFYVSADKYEVLESMRNLFPGKILSSPERCEDRDSKCVVWALLDLLCLSKTRKLLGSNWSSFTEAAQRLGVSSSEIAGQDFFPSDYQGKADTFQHTKLDESTKQGSSTPSKHQQMSMHLSF